METLGRCPRFQARVCEGGDRLASCLCRPCAASSSSSPDGRTRSRFSLDECDQPQLRTPAVIREYVRQKKMIEIRGRMMGQDVTVSTVTRSAESGNVHPKPSAIKILAGCTNVSIIHLLPWLWHQLDDRHTRDSQDEKGQDDGHSYLD